MKIFHKVPKYSQHLHIKNKDWKTKTCGIAGLCMILEYFDKKIPAEMLLNQGLKIKAYLPGIGWKHKGIVKLAKKFRLNGKNFDWAKLNTKTAFLKLKNYLKKYPILASIHLNFNPKNGGHLVVITGISETKIFYNDPDSKTEKQISKSIPIKKFLTGWKKRIIVIYP